jgi:restriction system protein
MARRPSAAVDLIELLARLPWWVGVVLAAVAFLVLSALASQPLTDSSGGRPSVNFVAIVATPLRWIVPGLCLLGVLGSVLARPRRAQLLASAQDDGAQAIARMDWREFELLVGEAFLRQGYSVVETGGGGADGGVELMLRKDGALALVQCKHWKAWQVGLPAVRKLLGAMTAKKAGRGWLVTSGRFTDEARAFAGEHGIELLDGEALAALLNPVAPVVQRPAAPGPNAGAPSCPRCGRPMQLRTARQGPSTGDTFWGCTGFPGCRGTRPKG